VTFNSVRPITASISGSGGFQAFYTGNTAVLAYADNSTPWNSGVGTGQVISAYTQTSTFGGSSEPGLF
jgi:hypothetical protein